MSALPRVYLQNIEKWAPGFTTGLRPIRATAELAEGRGIIATPLKQDGVGKKFDLTVLSPPTFNTANGVFTYVVKDGNGKIHQLRVQADQNTGAILNAHIGF